MDAPAGLCLEPWPASHHHPSTVSSHSGRSLGLPCLEETVLALLGKAGTEEQLNWELHF